LTLGGQRTSAARFTLLLRVVAILPMQSPYLKKKRDFFRATRTLCCFITTGANREFISNSAS
jgi:hypothetical protein